MYTLRNVVSPSEGLNEKGRQSDSCRVMHKPFLINIIVEQLAANSGIASRLAIGTNYPAIYEYVAASEDQNSLLELLVVVVLGQPVSLPRTFDTTGGRFSFIIHHTELVYKYSIKPQGRPYSSEQDFLTVVVY